MGTLTNKLLFLLLLLNGIPANSQDKKDYFYINNEGNEIKLDHNSEHGVKPFRGVILSIYIDGSAFRHIPLYKRLIFL